MSRVLGWAGLGELSHTKTITATARRLFVYSHWAAAADALSCTIPTPRHELVFSDLSLSDFRTLGEGLGEGLGVYSQHNVESPCALL